MFYVSRLLLCRDGNVSPLAEVKTSLEGDEALVCLQGKTLGTKKQGIRCCVP